MQPLTGELGARKDIVGVVERRQIRYAHMVGVTPEIMQQGMRADYKPGRSPQRKIVRPHAYRALAHRAHRSRHFARRHFRPRLDWVKTSGLISRALLVQSSRRRSFHHARESGRHIRVRRHCRRSFLRKIWRPATHSARPGN